MANLENSQRWSEIVEASREQSLPEVARQFGVKPGEIASALKRAGISRTAVTGNGAAGRTERAAAEPEAARDDGERASRQDAERDLDTRADSTSSARDGDDAREDGDTGRATEGTDDASRDRSRRSRSRKEPAEEPVAEAADTDEESQTRTDRGSRLDPFRDLIGAIPDAAVAQQSGMSIQAVRNYRQKRGIAPAGRRRTPDEVEIGRTAAPAAAPEARAVVAPEARTAAPEPRAAATPETPREEAPRPTGRDAARRDPAPATAYGWRIGLESGGQIVHRLVVAPDAAAAVARAAGAGLGDILTLERLEEAL